MTTFDKENSIIWMDGKLVQWPEAKIHIISHALSYGSSAFEGIRSYNGKPFKLLEHMQRLHHSANALGMKLPYSVNELVDAAYLVLKENNLGSCYIRPLIWRGAANTTIEGEGCPIHVSISAWPLFEGRRIEKRKTGVKLTISKWRKPPPNSSPFSTKAASIYTMATIIKNDAIAAGFDEALILDQEGFITEAATSNFFLVYQNQLHTAIPDCFLDGITRQTVIELAKAEGMDVVERKIAPSELAEADAAFLTGTATEIMPVACVDSVVFDHTHPTIAKIWNLYTRVTQG